MTDRLSDEDVADIILDGSTMAFQEEIHLLAREVQAWRRFGPTIDDLCARHGVTVDGIVALVDEVFDPFNDNAIEWLRRLARGEGQ